MNGFSISVYVKKLITNIPIRARMATVAYTEFDEATKLAFEVHRQALLRFAASDSFGSITTTPAIPLKYPRILSEQAKPPLTTVTRRAPHQIPVRNRRASEKCIAPCHIRHTHRSTKLRPPTQLLEATGLHMLPVTIGRGLPGYQPIHDDSPPTHSSGNLPQHRD